MGQRTIRALGRERDDVDAQIAALRRRLARTEDELAEQNYRVAYLKHQVSFRLASWLRTTRAWHFARWLRSRNRGVLRLRALAENGERNQGGEVWLLAVRPVPGARPLPWEAVELVDARRWMRERRSEAPYGEVIWTRTGTLRLPLYGDDPTLTFSQGPRGGKVSITYDGVERVIDLHADTPAEIDVHLRETGEACRSRRSAGAGAPSVGTASGTAGQTSARERRWVEETLQHPVQCLAVHTPRWIGVSAATQTLFEHCYPFPASAEVEPYEVSAAEARRQAALIVESGVRHVICSGGDEIHYHLMRELRRLDGRIRCDLLWHGSPMQFGEDYTWRLVQLWIEAAREGAVHTIGTVKKGLETFFQRLGCRSRFVMNYVPEVPTGPSVPDPGGPHLGLWLSGLSPWKLPYPMLAAAKLIPGSRIRTSNLGRRAAEVAAFLEVPGEFRADYILPRAVLRDAMRRTHLTLYVTFSECCPMLPLESLSVGTPALTGPTSHLFEDDEYLRTRLVVPYPDRPDVIAHHIRRALDERSDIVRRYIAYAPSYNARARESVREFLGP